MTSDRSVESRSDGVAVTPLTRRRYVVGLTVILVSIYSQYLATVPGHILNAVTVYGIPLLVISFLWGRQIVRTAFGRTVSAIKYGLGFFALFTILGNLAAAAVFYLILRLDPKAVSLLHRPDPVLHTSPRFAWVMVWMSLLLVGPAEEYLFRGFVYGGLLSLFRNRHWLTLALVSLVLFAAVHLYYALAYGIASLVQFTQLVAFAMAMAATYYFSGGNLVVPAVIHGVYDASAFLGITTSLTFTISIRWFLIAAGIVIAVILFVSARRRRFATL